MRYALLISYDGTNYGGWQIQKNSITVQQKLTEALTLTLGKPVTVTASGRTDSGVHASAQVCHFDADTAIPPERLADAVNFHLPEDISVLKSAVAPEGFDAVASAKKKTYLYRVYLARRRQPLRDRYAVHIKYPVDLERLASSGKLFEGEHDFKAYCASGSQVKTTVRTVYSVETNWVETPFYTDVGIRVTGNGFLYNMVRIIAGTLMEVGRGRIEPEQVKEILAAENRNAAGPTAPARGLTLVRYEFEQEQ